MVADAVVFEPVSTARFPLTGKRTGKIANFSLDQRFQRPVSERIQKVTAKFPKFLNREYFRRNRELIFKVQGISATKV